MPWVQPTVEIERLLIPVQGPRWDGTIIEIYEQDAHVRVTGGREIKRNVRIPDYIDKEKLKIGYRVRLEGDDSGHPYIAAYFEECGKPGRASGYENDCNTPGRPAVSAFYSENIYFPDELGRWNVSWKSLGSDIDYYIVYVATDINGSGAVEVGSTTGLGLIVYKDFLPSVNHRYFGVKAVSGDCEGQVSWGTGVIESMLLEVLYHTPEFFLFIFQDDSSGCYYLDGNTWEARKGILSGTDVEDHQGVDTPDWEGEVVLWKVNDYKVFKSINGGVDWTSTGPTTNPPNLYNYAPAPIYSDLIYTSLNIDPNDGDIVFVAGSYDDGGPVGKSSWIAKTTDGGATWTWEAIFFASLPSGSFWKAIGYTVQSHDADYAPLPEMKYMSGRYPTLQAEADVWKNHWKGAWAYNNTGGFYPSRVDFIFPIKITWDEALFESHPSFSPGIWNSYAPVVKAWKSATVTIRSIEMFIQTFDNDSGDRAGTMRWTGDNNVVEWLELADEGNLTQTERETGIFFAPFLDGYTFDSLHVGIMYIDVFQIAEHWHSVPMLNPGSMPFEILQIPEQVRILDIQVSPDGTKLWSTSWKTNTGEIVLQRRNISTFDIEFEIFLTYDVTEADIDSGVWRAKVLVLDSNNIYVYGRMEDPADFGLGTGYQAIIKSDDGGATWTSIAAWGSDYCGALTVKDGIIYAARCGAVREFYRQAEGGALGSSISAPPFDVESLDVYPGTNEKIVIGALSAVSLQVVALSDDLGLTWDDITYNLPTTGRIASVVYAYA